MHGSRSVVALPLHMLSPVAAVLNGLMIPRSGRAHVPGHSVCVGLSAGPQHSSLNDLQGQACQAIRMLNSLFSGLRGEWA